MKKIIDVSTNGIITYPHTRLQFELMAVAMDVMPLLRYGCWNSASLVVQDYEDERPIKARCSSDQRRIDGPSHAISFGSTHRTLWRERLGRWIADCKHRVWLSETLL